MTEPKYCDQHSAICQCYDDLRQHKTDSRSDRREMWDAIKQRVSWTIFLFVISIFVGIASAQFAQIHLVGQELRSVSDVVIEIKTKVNSAGR